MERTGEQIAREQWLQERKSGIGGSDAAAVLGYSRWATPLHVWLEKRGEFLEPATDEEREWLWWGRHVEPLIAKRYALQTGREVWSPQRIYRDRLDPLLIGTPDYLEVEENGDGLECKTARNPSDWGPAGTDEIPIEYLIQCTHYAMVTDRPAWNLAVLVAGSDFRVYHVRRDRDLEALMRERLVNWWRVHVEGGVRPDVDGHERTREWIAQRYPVNGPELLRATPETEEVAAALAVATREVNAWEERKTAAQNQLKLAIGENAGMLGEGWKISWRTSKGRRSTNWKTIAEWAIELLRDYGYEEPRESIIERHTEEGKGPRPFRFTHPGTKGAGNGE